jgi:DNA-binding transcriptional MerR regulator
LRYYDSLGLLSPKRIASNGYRIYGSAEVDTLQQILFYRELGVPLEEIRIILASKDYDRQAALESHLAALMARRGQLDILIENVKKTIAAEKGEIKMCDIEKFEGFKKKLIEENEEKYGAEIREKYGDDTVDRSNAKITGMSREEYAGLEKLTDELNKTLKAAFEQGDPAGEIAQKACALHKKWISYYWDGYSKEAHAGLAEMYVADPRFKAYYDKIAPGCAEFLRDAIRIYCK